MKNIESVKRKEIYNKLKKEGICVVCRKRKAEIGKVRCELCYNNMRENEKRIREKRTKEGKCCLCGCDKSIRDIKSNGEYYKNCYKCRDYKNKMIKIRKEDKRG